MRNLGIFVAVGLYRTLEKTFELPVIILFKDFEDIMTEKKVQLVSMTFDYIIHSEQRGLTTHCVLRTHVHLSITQNRARCKKEDRNDSRNKITYLKCSGQHDIWQKIQFLSAIVMHTIKSIIHTGAFYQWHHISKGRFRLNLQIMIEQIVCFDPSKTYNFLKRNLFIFDIYVFSSWLWISLFYFATPCRWCDVAVMFYHFSTLRWCRLLKYIVIEDNAAFIRDIIGCMRL